MSKQCPCGSFAINPSMHGRDASNNDLCDVCYWRTRAEKAMSELESALLAAREGRSK